MYPIILLGSIPGFLMALSMFQSHGTSLWWVIGAFTLGQSTAYALCRRYSL